MTRIPPDQNGSNGLRSRAVAHLTGPEAKAEARSDGSAALAVLYELASSPSTADDALTLLHELQVHQVEVHLQDEELRRSRIELEASLHRYIQLYDHAPVGYLAVDGNSLLREVNAAGASLLGFERDFLYGQSLEGFLTSESVSILRAVFGRVTDGAPIAFANLNLRAARNGEVRCTHASVCRDPAGDGFLVGLIAATGGKAIPVA